MGFLSKLFKKGTIIEAKQCIHIETGKIKGKHFGVVSKSEKKETGFHIFTHTKTGNNKPVDFSKFSNDFGKNYIDSETFITDAIFKNKTKKLKRPEKGGKYVI